MPIETYDTRVEQAAADLVAGRITPQQYVDEVVRSGRETADYIIRAAKDRPKKE